MKYLRRGALTRLVGANATPRPPRERTTSETVAEESPRCRRPQTPRGADTLRGVRRIRRRFFLFRAGQTTAARFAPITIKMFVTPARHPPPREHVRASRRARRRRRSAPGRLFPRPSCLDSTQRYSRGRRPIRCATHARLLGTTRRVRRGAPRDSRNPRSRRTRGSRLDDARAPSSLTTRPPSASARSHARKTPTSSPATT